MLLLSGKWPVAAPQVLARDCRPLQTLSVHSIQQQSQRLFQQTLPARVDHGPPRRPVPPDKALRLGAWVGVVWLRAPPREAGAAHVFVALG